MGSGIRPKSAGSAYCKHCQRRKAHDEDFNAPLCKNCFEAKARNEDMGAFVEFMEKEE